MMIVCGLVCAAIGAVLLGADLSQVRESDEGGGWVKSEAMLYEVGIRRSNAEPSASYAMTARYILRVDGRDYEGSAIARGYSSKSAVEVRSLIAAFAPEAAEYSLQDLGALNAHRSWSVAYRAVPARYDPRDPARSQLVLPKPLATDTARAWLSRGIPALFLLAAIVLLGWAWSVARRRGA